MHRIKAKKSEEGSAFVISILVLFVLSVLGMALILTTMTENDISINYRWGEQAFFNADAALEYAKNVLADYALNDSTFAPLLPPPRADVTVPDNTAPWPVGRPVDPLACADRALPGCRDYQYFVDQCPPGGGGPCVRVYIGKVLRRRGDNSLVQYDFRAPVGAVGDIDADGNPDIDGTVTVWVRRPIVGTEDYGATGTDRGDRVIITAEGTAPGQATGLAGRPVS